MSEFFLEILSEEIPARMQAKAANDLKRLAESGLKEAGLTFDSVKTFVTPRRLILVADGLPDRQPDIREERKGPKADAPEKAIAGFLNSVGLSRDQVEERANPKGNVLFAVIEKDGSATAEILPNLVSDSLDDLGWPKSMRWAPADMTWVRPLRGLTAIFDGSVLDFDLQLGASDEIGHVVIEASAEAAGHRFHAPDDFAVADFSAYQKKMRAAHVMIDAGERRALIETRANELAAAEGLALIDDPALLDEVTGLVEWPVPLIGSIDPQFLGLPPEVLRTSMRSHQKYFSLQDKDGKFADRFILVANIDAKDGGKAIVAGNERVLRARLADAKFFWDQDRKKSLASRTPALEKMVFHAKLGTLAQKVDRVAALAAEIAGVTGADTCHAEAAARLAKADLVTGLVGEFPDLQGVIGRYYALADGENKDVAQAIADHYSPQGPNDACPSVPVSVALALADKIDTLVGFFAIDEKPTGSKDPFALRRAALGIIRLIVENGVRLRLGDILDKADALHGATSTDPDWNHDTAPVIDFIAERLKSHMRGQGARHDLIAAVFALTGEDDLVRLLARVEALRVFLEGEDGANLLVAYKRAANIVRIEEKKDSATYEGAANPDLLEEKQERHFTPFC